MEWRHALSPQNGYEFDDFAEYAAEANVDFEKGEESHFPTEYTEYSFMTVKNGDSLLLDSEEESDGSPEYVEDNGGPSENDEESCGPAEYGDDYDAPPEHREDSDNLEVCSMSLDSEEESDGPAEHRHKYSLTPKNGENVCGPNQCGDNCGILLGYDKQAENEEESCVNLGKDHAGSLDQAEALSVPAKNKGWSGVLYKGNRTGIGYEIKRNRRGRRSRWISSKARSKRKQAAKNAVQSAINRLCRELSKAADETEPEPGWAERQKEKIRAWRAEREAKPDWAERQVAFILEWRLMRSAYLYRQYHRAIKQAGLFRSFRPLRPSEKPGSSAFYEAKMKEKAFLDEEKARVRKWAEEVWGPTIIKAQPAKPVEDVQPNSLHAEIREDLAPSTELSQTHPLHMEPKDVQLNLLPASVNQELTSGIELTQTYPRYMGPQVALHQAPLDINPGLHSVPKKLKGNLSQPAIKSNVVTANSINMELLANLHQASLNLKPGLSETSKNLQPNLSQVVVRQDLAPLYTMHIGQQLTCHQAPLNLKPGLLETPKNFPLNFYLAPSLSLDPAYAVQIGSRTGGRPIWTCGAPPTHSKLLFHS